MAPKSVEIKCSYKAQGELGLLKINYESKIYINLHLIALQ